MVHFIATPLAGIATSDIELTFLGLLPGSSKYFFDFDLYANPDVNAYDRRVYWGKMRYEKKLLWLVRISHTITERTKYAPNGYLPFDTYSGGYYDFVDNISFDFQQYLPSGTVVNPRYGFIPVVSALDIKRNNGNVSPTDYLKSYAGGNTPETALTSGFNNFIVDFMPNPINNKHVSFQPRNGNWLANELEEETNLIEDCSFVCSASQIGISGNELICNGSTNTYTLPAGAENYAWQITSGTNLATINNSNTNAVSLTTTSNTTLSGSITLQGTISSTRCNNFTQTIRKQIWVGKPSITTRVDPNHNLIRVNLIGASNTNIKNQGITRTTWEKVSTYGCAVNFGGSNFLAVAYGACYDFFMMAKITATNACGTTTIYRGISPPTPLPCDDRYRMGPVASSNKVYGIIYPCKTDTGPGPGRLGYSGYGREDASIKVLDRYGKLVLVSHTAQIDLSSLKSGIYFIKAYVDRQVITHKVIL